MNEEKDNMEFNENVETVEVVDVSTLEIYDSELESLKLEELKKIASSLEKLEVHFEDEKILDDEFRTQQLEFNEKVDLYLFPEVIEDEILEEETDLYLPVLEMIATNTNINENIENLNYLEEIKNNTGVQEYEHDYITAQYYGNLSIILLVLGIIPAYIAYRLIKSVVSLVRYI